MIIKNVLSLFDGISCGQLALKRAGIKYKKYYASEIDKNAISVTQYHFPKTKQLGSVTKVNKTNLPKIDLLLGGSPCQGFSKAGKQLNFNDPRSKLFFEYVRIKNEVKPKYFLLENVPMKDEWIDIISEKMGVDPIKINSKRYSKQNRIRLYWTNIPYFQAHDKKLYFNKYMYVRSYTEEYIKFYKKHPTLMARSPENFYRIIINLKKIEGLSFKEIRKRLDIARIATPEECEEFQTLPINYTSILNKTNRYKAIGNGWTVDVIVQILKGLKLKLF